MTVIRCDVCGKDISGMYYICKLDNTETNWILGSGAFKPHYDICADCIEKITKLKGDSNADLD